MRGNETKQTASVKKKVGRGRSGRGSHRRRGRAAGRQLGRPVGHRVPAPPPGAGPRCRRRRGTGPRIRKFPRPARLKIVFKSANSKKNNYDFDEIKQFRSLFLKTCLRNTDHQGFPDRAITYYFKKTCFRHEFQIKWPENKSSAYRTALYWRRWAVHDRQKYFCRFSPRTFSKFWMVTWAAISTSWTSSSSSSAKKGMASGNSAR